MGSNQAVLLLATVHVWAVEVAAGQQPSIARELRHVAKDVETISCERPSAISLLPNYGTARKPDPEVAERERRLERARAAVARRLRNHPDDAAAWVLAARIAYIAGGCGSWAGSWEDSVHIWSHPPLDVAPLLADLDRALTLRPDYAEAHYWKSILYHIEQPVPDSLGVTRQDLDRTIQHARQAAELDPRTSAYRVLWATALVEADRMPEALRVLRELDGGRHPLYLILRDFDALPLPAGAFHLGFPRESTEGMPDWASLTMYAGAMMSSYIGQSPELELTHTVPLGRLRSWVVPLSLNALETFYERQWPGFRFVDSTTVEGVTIRAQHLSVDEALKFTPAHGGTVILRGNVKDGLVMMVAEPPAGSDTALIRPPMIVGDMPAQTLMIVLNYRGSQQTDSRR